MDNEKIVFRMKICDNERQLLVAVKRYRSVRRASYRASHNAKSSLIQHW